MKRSNILSLSIIITTSLFLSGCYTQFSSIDRYSSDSNRNSKYYSWNDDELSEAGYYWDDEEQTAKPYSYSSQTQDDDYVSAEEAGLYYKDYDAEQWYKDNNFEGVYWDGYDEGFEDGYQEGYYDGYDDGSWDSEYYYTHLRYGWVRIYGHHWYYDWNLRHNSYYTFGAGFGLGWDVYSNHYGFGYHRPYYYTAWGYGHPYYLNYGFYSNHYYYGYTNNYYYNNSRRNSRNYSYGPRSSGLTQKNDNRTRGSSLRSRSSFWY